jgi:predicted transcriptional regulator
MQAEQPSQTILLALKPRFAEAILSGTKTVELRRQRVALKPGAAVLIYASSPVMAILGTARVQNVERGSTEEIWLRYAARVGLAKTEYDAYMADVESVSAISLEEPSFLDRPITLRQLRGEQPFHPPQSYCFVSSSSPGILGAITSQLTTS